LKTFLRNKNKVAIIPFFNEEHFLSRVIADTLPHVDFLILVNDGSTDGSKDKIPQDPKILLIESPVNEGKGAALNHGFREAIALNAEFVITLDGDGQHSPECIPEFFEKLKANDCVIGARKKIPGIMPPQRILSNFLTSLMLSMKVGRKVRDSQSGFRGYRVAALSGNLPKNTGFMAETEILINLLRKNLRLGYVEIPTIYEDQQSKMNPIESILHFIRLMLFH
jgi:glycosyltransferase involved in cell wall biosynthesis